jgi:hypothetical protein
VAEAIVIGEPDDPIYRAYTDALGDEQVFLLRP